jgi:SpoIIAA-like
MIAVLEGFPDGVTAFAAEGRVTKKDYDDVLIPTLEDALRRRKKIRCYYELGTQYLGIDPGAAWKDFKLGIKYLSRWERVVVVTDVLWIRVVMKACRFLVPGEIRVYENARISDARNWVAAE